MKPYLITFAIILALEYIPNIIYFGIMYIKLVKRFKKEEKKTKVVEVAKCGAFYH